MIIRLTTLLLSNNTITRISNDIGNQLKNLKALILTNNRIVNLAEVGYLSGLTNLEHLSLLDNPVTFKVIIDYLIIIIIIYYYLYN